MANIMIRKKVCYIMWEILERMMQDDMLNVEHIGARENKVCALTEIWLTIPKDL